MAKVHRSVIDRIKTNCGNRPQIGCEMRYNGVLLKAVEIREGWDSYNGCPDAEYDYFTVVYKEVAESADDDKTT